MPTLTTQQITTVDVSPEVVTRLETAMAVYQALKEQAEAIETEMDAEKATIKALIEETGLKSLKVSGVPCVITSRKNKTFDKVKFVSLGGSLKLIDDCTSEKDGKPYLRIGAEKS